MSADLWKEIFWPLAFLWDRPEIIPLALTGILAWWILTIIILEKPIQRFLDKHLRPKGEKKVYETSPGERMHLALFQNFETTVLWEIPGQIFRYLALALGGGMAIMTITPIAVLIVDPYRGLVIDPVMVNGFWVWVLIVTVIGVPQTYHFRRWDQRNWHVVQFSKKLFFIRGIARLLALVGLAEAYYISSTDPRYIEEFKVAPDPETLDPRFKTPWLRDRWTEFWAREPRDEPQSTWRKILRWLFWFIPEGKDVAAVFVPARATGLVSGGEDFFNFTENASNFASAQPKIRQYIDLLATAESFYMSTSVSASDDAYGPQENIAEAERAFESQWQRGQNRLSSWAEPRPWDLFEDITETVISAEGIGARRPAPVADDEMARKYAELFPEGEFTPQTGQETPRESEDVPKDFPTLWKTLSRKQRKALSKAGVALDLAMLIHERVGETPRTLLSMVEEGLDSSEILERLGVFGKPSREGPKSGTLPEGKPAPGIQRPRKPPEPPNEGSKRFLREDDE